MIVKCLASFQSRELLIQCSVIHRMLTECMQTADEVIKTRPTGSRSQFITEHLTEANRD